MFCSIFLVAAFFVQVFALSLKACPPDSVYLSNSDLCYKFHTELLTFNDAEAKCVEQHGNLAVIDSALTNAQLASKAQNFSLDEYFIGAMLNNSDSKTLLSSNGDRFLTYDNWFANEPDMKGKCVVVKSEDSSWLAIDCSHPKPFVCSFPSFYPREISVCEPEWTYFEESDSCYKTFIHVNSTWRKGEDVCVSEGAHLASIHSEAENDFVYTLGMVGFVDGYSWQGTAIGFYVTDDSNVDEDSFVWVDGSEVDYKNWYKAQPDFKDEYCSNFKYKQWNNYGCDKPTENFVCKKPADKIVFV